MGGERVMAQDVTFTACAMPTGDPAYGVTTPGVMIIERRGGQTQRVRFLTTAEAGQLRCETGKALAALPPQEQEAAGYYGCYPIVPLKAEAV